MPLIKLEPAPREPGLILLEPAPNLPTLTEDDARKRSRDALNMVTEGQASLSDSMEYLFLGGQYVSTPQITITADAPSAEFGPSFPVLDLFEQPLLSGESLFELMNPTTLRALDRPLSSNIELGDPRASGLQKLNAYSKYFARRGAMFLTKPIAGLLGLREGLEATVLSELQSDLDRPGFEAIFARGGAEQVAREATRSLVQDWQGASGFAKNLALLVGGDVAEMAGAMIWIHGGMKILRGPTGKAVEFGANRWVRPLVDEASLFATATFSMSMAEGKAKEEALADGLAAGAWYFGLGAAGRGVAAVLGRGRAKFPERAVAKEMYKRLGLKPGASYGETQAAFRNIMKANRPAGGVIDPKLDQSVNEAWKYVQAQLRNVRPPTPPVPKDTARILTDTIADDALVLADKARVVTTPAVKDLFLKDAIVLSRKTTDGLAAFTDAQIAETMLAKVSTPEYQAEQVKIANLAAKRDITPEQAKEALELEKAPTKPPDEIVAQEGLEQIPGVTPPVGRPELASLSTDPAVRDFIDTVDEGLKAKGEPEKITIEEMNRQADEIMADPEQRAATLEKIVKGEGYGPVERGVARKHIEKHATDWLSGKNTKEGVAFIEGERRTRSQWGRQGAMMHDPLMTPAERMSKYVTESVLSVGAQTRKHIEALRDQLEDANLTDTDRKGIQAEIDTLITNATEKIDILRDRLRKIGIDLDTITLDELSDPRIAGLIIRESQTFKADWGDKIYEFWMNGLLSLPLTQIRNIVGNTANLALEGALFRPIEATLNDIQSIFTGKGIKDAPTWTEVVEVTKAIPDAFKMAAIHMSRSMATEISSFEMTITGRAIDKLDWETKAIKGKKGRVIRTPSAVLRAADEAFKSVIGRMEAAAQSHRLAKVRGLKGDARREFMAEQIEDVTSQSWDTAVNEARRLTFQEELGVIGQEVLRVRKVGHKLSKYFPPTDLQYYIPFVTTLVNIFKQGVQPTVLYTPRFIQKLLRYGFDGAYRRTSDVTGRKLLQDASRQIIGLATFGWLATMVFSEDEEDGLPMITGTVPYTPSTRAKRDLAYRTAPPMSIRVPGTNTYWNYTGIEPFSTTLAIQVDALYAVKDISRGADAGDVAGKALQSVVAMMKDKTMAEGIARIIDASSSEKGLAILARQHAVSWVPNIIRGTARNFDPYIRDSSAASEGFLDTLGKQFALARYQWLPAEFNAPPPKLDVWGRAIKKQDTVVERFLSPLRRTHTDQINEFDAMIRRYNEQNPAEAWAPAAMSRRIEYTDLQGEKQKHILTPEQYFAVQKMAGDFALETATYFQFETRNPGPGDIELIGNIIAAGRRAARAIFVSEELLNPKKDKP